MEYTEIIGPHLHGPCVTYSVYEGVGNDCELVKGTAFECFKEVNAHIKYHFGEGYAVYDDKGFFARWYPVCQAKKENEWAVMEDNGGTNN